MENKKGKNVRGSDFIFLGYKITADSDYSHEIKRRLLLGRKAMTNLDSVLKSRENTLTTKVRLVKAMVFPVVMYGCENLDHKDSWALKNWCFWTVVLEKTLESPLDCKEIKPVNPKENQLWILLEGLMLKLHYFRHLMWRTDSLEKTLMLGKIEGRRRRGDREWDGLVGWYHWLSEHEFEQSRGDSEGQGGLSCCSPWDPESQTQLSNWTTAMWVLEIKLPSKDKGFDVIEMKLNFVPYFLWHFLKVELQKVI